MILRTSSASAALRTKLSAMKSTVRCSAKRRSSMSFSDSAGTETATPGRLMPLWLLTLPPTSTSVMHVGAVLDLGDPQPDLAVVDEDRVADLHVAGEPLVRRPADLGVAVDVAGGDRPPLARACSWTGPSANVSSRIFGPCRSARIADAVARWRPRPRGPAGRPPRGPRGSPWLMFSRATSIPAYTSSRIRRSESRWPGPGCTRSWLSAREQP